MKITVFNLTSQDISAIPSFPLDVKATLVPTSSTASLTINVARQLCQRRAGLILRSEAEQSAQLCELNADTLAFRARRFDWALVASKQEERSGWRVYLTRSKVDNITECNVFVLPKRDLSCFLKDVEDTRALSDVCLPSTHDTLSLHGWPISQCQSQATPFSVQLQSGIRAFDIRMAVVNGRLIAHHGIFPERTPFQDVLTVVHAFLTDPHTSSETIIVSIKQEDFATTPATEFSTLVHDELFSGPGGSGMWFLENRIPQLGEVRGKVIMLSRFGGDGAGWENGLEGMGIHPTTWPDSQQQGFEWTLKDTLVRTSDWYNIPSLMSIPEKFSLATAVLLPPSPGGYTQPTLNIAFFSAGSFPLALPPTVAKGFGWPAWKLGVEGMNARLGKWLLDQLSAPGGTPPKGWVFMDFFKTPEGLAPLLVECNYRTTAA
ncbi:hypothetical protein M0805_006457 [Coniferiporia weirii]|nr:hypothetical protein M0805_006457 [Coniferiporia weirii]